jgi:hypothetical protein
MTSLLLKTSDYLTGTRPVPMGKGSGIPYRAWHGTGKPEVLERGTSLSQAHFGGVVLESGGGVAVPLLDESGGGVVDGLA